MSEEKQKKSAKELMAEFEKKAAKVKAETADTKAISRLCLLYSEAKKIVQDIERKEESKDGPMGLVAILKEQKKQTEAKLIETMEKENVPSITVGNYLYSINPVDSYSVKKENQPLRNKWLNEVNAGILKNTYTITGDEQEFMTWLIEAWEKDNDETKPLPLTIFEAYVHPATFSTWVKDTWPTVKKSLPEENQKLPEFISEFHGKMITMRKQSNKQGE